MNWRNRRNPIRMPDAFVSIALLVVLFVVICAIWPGTMAPYESTEMNADEIMVPPGIQHPFGTDYFGRDVFSLVVYGSRDSLLIGVASVLIGGLAGSLLGALAGYLGGAVDMAIMRLVDILMTIPGILLALAVAAAMGHGFFNSVLAIGISIVPGFARVLRGQIANIRGRSFITAARSLGAGKLRILVRHILPHSWQPLLVMATVGMGSAILAGSGLSFLGLGMLNDAPDWGTLLSQGRSYMKVCWWMSAFPGIAITLLVLSVNVLGDKLRDYADPKSNTKG